MKRKYLSLCLLLVLAAILLTACASSEGEITILSPADGTEFSLDTTQQAYVLLNVQLESTFDRDVVVKLSVDGQPLPDCTVTAESKVVGCLPMPVMSVGEHVLRVSYAAEDGKIVTRSSTVTWDQPAGMIENAGGFLSASASRMFIAFTVSLFLICAAIVLLRPQLGSYRHIDLHHGTDTRLLGVSTGDGTAAASAITAGRSLADINYQVALEDPAIIDAVSSMVGEE